MRTFRLSVFLAVAASASLLVAQNTSTAQANATVAPAKPKPNESKYLVKVHVLKTMTPARLESPDWEPCYSGDLMFPATNAAEVAKTLSEKDYTFVAIPPDRVAIYYKDRSQTPPNLDAIEKNLDKLAIADFRHADAITVPHGAAAKTLKQLNLPSDSPITATAVDDNCILLLSKTEPPDPVATAALRKSLPQLYWHAETTSPTQRLFHLDASAVVKQLASASDSGSDKSSAGTGASSKPGASSASKSNPAPGNTLAQNVAVSVAADGGPADSTGPGDTTDASDPSKGSSKPSSDAAKKEAPAPPKPPTMQAVNDTLVYSNDDGTDRGIFERNRLMTVLDLPRPEVLMNIWSLQVSTKNPQTASREAEAASELISYHNEALENSIEEGWEFLSKQMAGNGKKDKDKCKCKDKGERKDKDKNKDTGFFEPRFYEYVTKKFAEDKTYIQNADPLLPLAADDLPTGETNLLKEELERRKKQKEEQKKKRKSQLDQIANADWDSAVGRKKRERWGWCDPRQYCLGFIHAFEPVRPTLTNILLTIMAAKDSKQTADGVIDAIECREKPDDPKPCCPLSVEKPDPSEVDATVQGRFEKCLKDERKLINTFKDRSTGDCELDDRIALLDRIIEPNRMRTLQLRCFREQADQSFGPDSGEQDGYGTTRVGLLRAAVADFLFNYKWATEYPHDFVPYDLTQSAQELNAEFNPLVLAFNRDVKAFTQNLETELQCKHDAYTPSNANPLTVLLKRKSDDAFVNDGMISVRGISGVESIVDTVTQSFFDATKPPSLTDLVKAVSDAEKNVPGVLKANLSADEAAVLLGALNSVQPAESKIGRELKLDITPHTLAGASSAELEVKLTADEAGSPTLYKADKQTEDTISRVAKHDTNTRVRVESLKLFDVSSFSAMLQRPRSKFPIVPPFFEVPYFGSFIGWPLSGAKVFHRSTAIVSAIIVPTAADLAFGIEFSTDRVCNDSNNPNQPLVCHAAHSPYDFGNLPLRSFHKAMVQCFASGGKTGYAGLLSARIPEETDAARNSCANLSLVKSDGATPHPGTPETERTPSQDASVPPL